MALTASWSDPRPYRRAISRPPTPPLEPVSPPKSGPLSPALVPAPLPSPSPPPPNVLQTLNALFVLSDGRDKVLKLTQYTLKLVLYYRTRPSPFAITPGSPLHAALLTFTAQLSITRKLLRLFHFLDPLDTLLQRKDANPLPTLLALVNDVADDVYCLSKIGGLPARWNGIAERWSLRAWFTGTLLELYKQAKTRRRLRQQQKDVVDPQSKTQVDKKLFWLQLSIFKLVMDAIFCAYDLFPIRSHLVLQTWTGLMSGLASSYKLWCKARLLI
ncbi:hypothetical protein BZG36_04004 [Bifiguratus adelaidae]|uniref:Peroxisomal membrane protein PEX11 n=1 Tax=Bifiguratus adelaidae TaxID=1938954 RepID=A0A261XYS1_9FUNG|nr:hypothetical protein BZG36_04004 [Bifiguratus adelaidae]